MSIPNFKPLPGVQRAYEPDPGDRLSPVFASLWTQWVLEFFVIETCAFVGDAKHRDRVKRTLSSFLRFVFATDSVTGVPLAVPHGRLRRFALSTGVNWFTHHIGREGEM